MTTRKGRPHWPAVVRETAERHVGIRDLKATLSECVREVKAGGTIVVTEHGRPVARLVPESASLRDRMLALAAVGEVVWSGEPYRPARPAVKVRGSRTLSDLIVEERDRE